MRSRYWFYLPGKSACSTLEFRMTAKAELIAIFSDSELSNAEMFSAALSTSRRNKLGLAPLKRLLEELHQSSATPGSVEEAIRELTDIAIARNRSDGKQQALEEGEITDMNNDNDNNETQDTRIDTVSDNVQHGHTTADSSYTEEHRVLAENSMEKNNQIHDLSLILDQLAEIGTTMHSLKVMFEEEKRIAADRENRLTRKIKELHTQVNDLTSALQEEKLSNEAREQRLTKQLNDLKSRLLSNPTCPAKNNQPRNDKEKSNQKNSRPQEFREPVVVPGMPASNDVDKVTDQVRIALSSTPPQELRESAAVPCMPASHDVDQVTEQVRIPLSTVLNDHPSYATAATIHTTSAQNRTVPNKPKRTSTTLPHDQWKTQQKKRVTVADQEKKPLGKLVGAPRVRKKVYYVGGIDPACTAEDLTQYCEDSCPILDCRLMPSRRSGTWSAYVQVAEDLSHRFDSINWPENMYARPWTFDERHPIRSETMKVQCN